MKLLKIKSEVLNKALQSRKFPSLQLYIGDIKRTEDNCFVAELVWQPYDENWTTDLKLGLQDYFFNESESKELWKLAEKIIGEQTIDLKIIKIIEL